jgi:hypothetical protein
MTGVTFDDVFPQFFWPWPLWLFECAWAYCCRVANGPIQSICCRCCSRDNQGSRRHSQCKTNHSRAEGRSCKNSLCCAFRKEDKKEVSKWSWLLLLFIVVIQNTGGGGGERRLSIRNIKSSFYAGPAVFSSSVTEQIMHQLPPLFDVNQVSILYTVKKGYRFSCPQPGCH